MILGGWSCVSLVLCWVLGVFRLQKLALAPARNGRLSLLHFFAAIGLYLGLGIVAAAIMGAAHPELIKETGVASASEPGARPATGPATWPAATSTAPSATATASRPSTAAALLNAPATASTNDPTTLTRRVQVEVQQNFANLFCTAAVCLLMLILAQRCMMDGLAGFGLSMRKVPLGIVLGLLTAIVIGPMLQASALFSEILNQLLNTGPEPIHPVLQMARESSNVSLRAMLIFTAVVAAPFSEELLFRGFLQTALVGIFRKMVPAQWRQKNEITPPASAELWYAMPESDVLVRLEALARLGAILMASVLFAAVHYSAIGWQGMPEIFVLSLGLGYVYERTGNLWANITLHATFNAVSFAAFLGVFGS